MIIPLIEILRFCAEHELTVRFRKSEVRQGQISISVFHEESSSSAIDHIQAETLSRISASVAFGCVVSRLQYQLANKGIEGAEFQLLPGDVDANYIQAAPAVKTIETKERKAGAKSRDSKTAQRKTRK